MYQAVLVNLILICPVYCKIDYWSDDFDAAKNCEHKELMERLEGDSSRCTSFRTGSDKVRWEECKKYLGKNLAASCPDTKIEKVKEFIIVQSPKMMGPFRLEYFFIVNLEEQRHAASIMSLAPMIISTLFKVIWKSNPKLSLKHRIIISIKWWMT